MTRYHKPSRASDKQVDEIRAMREAGKSCSTIADQLGFTERAIRTLCASNAIPSNYKHEPTGPTEDKHDSSRVHAWVDLHVKDIISAHGPDKRWANHSIREGAGLYVPVYHSTSLSVVGSPAMTCAEASGVD